MFNYLQLSDLEQQKDKTCLVLVYVIQGFFGLILSCKESLTTTFSMIFHLVGIIVSECY